MGIWKQEKSCTSKPMVNIGCHEFLENNKYLIKKQALCDASEKRSKNEIMIQALFIKTARSRDKVNKRKEQ